MAHTILNLTIRNREAARVLTNALNQGTTVTYTFTVANTGDMSTANIVGTLVATTASVVWPPDVMPVGTQPDIAALPQSN